MEDLFYHGWVRFIYFLLQSTSNDHSLLIGLYLVNLEVTIVSTSLINITDDLNGFQKTSWVVTGFLTTYTAFMAQWTKISNIIGRKRAVIAADLAFLAFSLGCGLAQNMNQLIIFRSLQGAGGAGVYSLTILCVYEVAPKSKIPFYGAMVAITIALASLTGPIFGGLLAEHSAWRWVFYINLPPGGLAVMMLFIAMPSSFGTATPLSMPSLRPSLWLFKRFDALGSFLLLSASLLLVTVLNETSIEFSWSSGAAIGLLTLSGTLWIAFFTWEWYIPDYMPDIEAIFPRRFVYNKAWMGMLLTNFLCGCPWNVVIVYLAQRFQVLTKFSTLEAGIHIIPYSAVATGATMLTCLISRKFCVPVVYFALIGSILHTVGMSLFSILPENTSYPPEGYGYEAIAGAGVGITIGILTLAVPYIVEPRDLATATGALNQARFLGGAIGLAIASNILYGKIKSELSDTLSPEQVDQVLEKVNNIDSRPQEVQKAAVDAFARSYTRQFQTMIAFAALQIPASLLIFKRGRQYVAA
ncbi:major facilitator superfamily domain-containing protein [Penicillium argentinense]|uniref:Major facilitator superfamily domain-containing protein n=1 Tax=Penicillium argentinense TaxID=1131581 RepID=A0A9W9G4Z4_9EURO|nr:major facilitator superfamily domain-containing protein [Penicillium argentinense]KAJ5112256.1 major facilitator superfamily domain-containing protein [Penicillium argentinense]